MTGVLTSAEATPYGRSLAMLYLKQRWPNLEQFFEGRPPAEISAPTPVTPTEPGLRKYADIAEIAKPKPTQVQEGIPSLIGRKPPKELAEVLAVLDRTALTEEQRAGVLGRYMTSWLKKKTLDPSEEIASVEDRNGLFYARYKDGHEEIMTNRRGEPVHKITNGGSPTTGFWRRDEYTGEILALTPRFDPETTPVGQREKWLEASIRGYLPSIAKNFSFKSLNWFDVGTYGKETIDWEGKTLPYDAFLKALGVSQGFDVIVNKEPIGTVFKGTRYKISINRDLFVAKGTPYGVPTGSPAEVEKLADEIRKKKPSDVTKGVPLRKTRQLQVKFDPSAGTYVVRYEGEEWREPTPRELEYVREHIEGGIPVQ